ncbi:Hsp20/alpha crystallin family protein [Methanospirillum lacunae]|uniref:SHSP domain-containing protein n=1 Tax=Methanospirillum lacunae TaxID=668570 RepID=A0A2V2NGI3_9EURY|nr:Hsp20/alpha crystallin family protein [Methanospirillum lacunae]PWR74721.1 hypothetical protein DK846_00270 [Methanospirillum lacunae]
MSLFKKEKGTEITPSRPGSAISMRDRRIDFVDDFDSIFNDFRQSFDNLMKPYFPVEFFPREMMDFHPVKFAPLDLVDEGDHYRVQVELPGMSKEDVEVNITANRLQIQAQKESSTENSDTNYLHRERYSSVWRREVSFPEEVCPDKSQGTMKDGVLELNILKKEPKTKDQSYSIKIN